VGRHQKKSKKREKNREVAFWPKKKAQPRLVVKRGDGGGEHQWGVTRGLTRKNGGQEILVQATKKNLYLRAQRKGREETDASAKNYTLGPNEI